MVSYHRVSFTSQYEQLFASVQNCTTSFWMQGVYIVYWVTSLLMYCNASAWDCERCWKMTTRTANNRRDHERTTITRIFCEPMKTRLWSAAEEREKADVDEEIRNDWMLAAAFVDRILFITFRLSASFSSDQPLSSSRFSCWENFLLFPWLWPTTVSFQQLDEVQCACVGLYVGLLGRLLTRTSTFIVMSLCWRLKVSKNVSVSTLQGLGLV